MRFASFAFIASFTFLSPSQQMWGQGEVQILNLPVSSYVVSSILDVASSDLDIGCGVATSNDTPKILSTGLSRLLFSSNLPKDQWHIYSEGKMPALGSWVLDRAHNILTLQYPEAEQQTIQWDAQTNSKDGKTYACSVFLKARGVPDVPLFTVTFDAMNPENTAQWSSPLCTCPAPQTGSSV